MNKRRYIASVSAAFVITFLASVAWATNFEATGTEEDAREAVINETKTTIERCNQAKDGIVREHCFNQLRVSKNLIDSIVLLRHSPKETPRVNAAHEYTDLVKKLYDFCFNSYMVDSVCHENAYIANSALDLFIAGDQGKKPGDSLSGDFRLFNKKYFLCLRKPMKMPDSTKGSAQKACFETLIEKSGLEGIADYKSKIQPDLAAITSECLTESTALKEKLPGKAAVATANFLKSRGDYDPEQLIKDNLSDCYSLKLRKFMEKYEVANEGAVSQGHAIEAPKK